MAAFQSGFRLGQSAFQQMLDNKDREERRARENEEFGWRRTQFDNQQKDRQRLDEAYAGLENLQSGIDAEQGAKITQTYGLTPQQIATQTRQGGAEGLRSKLAEYDQPDSFDLQNVPDGGRPGFNAAGLKPRQATDLDIERQLGVIATAQRDTKGIRDSQANQRKLTLDAGRKAELKRLNDMTDQELAKYLGKHINPRTDVQAMVGYNEKTKQFMFTSDIPGFPSQSLSRAELINVGVGLWEQGNGDYDVGIQRVMNGTATQRGLENSNFDRSLRFADASAQQDNRQATLADSRARTAIAANQARLGRIDTYVGPDGKPIKGEIILDPKTGEPIVRPVGMKGGLQIPVTPPPLKMNDDGTAQIGDRLFERNAKTGQWTDITPGRKSALDLAIERKLSGEATPAGESAPAASATPQAPQAPRRFDGQRFGILTPRAIVEEAARAGNPDAIRFLQGQLDNQILQQIQYGQPQF